MLIFEKKIGETPLEMLNRFRLENLEYEDSKLSYIGRLDPMAHGKMIILVGEENKDYKKHLNYDKEYEAEFVFGMKTDSGDILGLITEEDSTEIKENEIRKQVLDFKKIKKQKYPWFSAMTVGGIKLFDHFKSGNLDVDRPVRNIKIKDVEILEFNKISLKDLERYIYENIEKVNGDFRQKEIINRWETFFNNSSMEFMTVKIRINVSTGTYIRGLTDNFNYPNTLLTLKRTKIGV